MTDFTITRTQNVRRGVVHVRAGSQELLTHLFVRLQEFYESPVDSIREHYFTLADLAEVYVPRHKRDRGTGRFTYYTDWHGYNVPGHIIQKFYETFTDLTHGENMLREAVSGFDMVYLIGSHEGDDPSEDALDHELVHATYYLDDDYRAAVNRQVELFRETPTHDKLVALLKDWCYCDEVITDEINAYLATTEEAWWAIKTGSFVFARALANESEAFKSLAKIYRTGTRWL